MHTPSIVVVRGTLSTKAGRSSDGPVGFARLQSQSSTHQECLNACIRGATAHGESFLFLLGIGMGMGIGSDVSDLTMMVDLSERVELLKVSDFSERVEVKNVEAEKMEVGDLEDSEVELEEESEGELDTELAPETCLKS